MQVMFDYYYKVEHLGKFLNYRVIYKAFCNANEILKWLEIQVRDTNKNIKSKTEK